MVTRDKHSFLSSCSFRFVSMKFVTLKYTYVRTYSAKKNFFFRVAKKRSIDKSLASSLCVALCAQWAIRPECMDPLGGPSHNNNIYNCSFDCKANKYTHAYIYIYIFINRALHACFHHNWATITNSIYFE